MADVLTNGGRAFFTAALMDAGLGTVYLAVGTGAGTAAATDTAMFDEDTVTGRHATTIAQATDLVLDDSLSFFVDIGFPVVNETVTEVGLWSAPTGGTLLYHRAPISVIVGPTNGTTSVAFTEEVTLD